MKEYYAQAIKLLPDKRYIEEFFLAYRPWIRNKFHVYLVLFMQPGWVSNKRAYDENYPYLCRAFGATPEEALINFINSMKTWNEPKKRKGKFEQLNWVELAEDDPA